MKTVKTTLIAIATIIGVAALFFFGSAFISAMFQAKHMATAQRDMFKNEEKADVITSKLDSAAKKDIGKTVHIDATFTDPKSTCTAMQKTSEDDSDIICPVDNGQKVKVLLILSYYHKVRIRYKGKKGYIDYNDIAEYRNIAVLDTFHRKI